MSGDSDLVIPNSGVRYKIGMTRTSQSGNREMWTLCFSISKATATALHCSSYGRTLFCDKTTVAKLLILQLDRGLRSCVFVKFPYARHSRFPPSNIITHHNQNLSHQLLVFARWCRTDLAMFAQPRKYQNCARLYRSGKNANNQPPKSFKKKGHG